MGQDLFAHLPSETKFDILSRLSVRSIALSKCVCKPWLDLLGTDDFVDSYHSKSATALAVPMPVTTDSIPFKVFELDDGLDDLESHNSITNFDFPRKARFGGSSDNLIFLRCSKVNFDALYVCNPITREFIELPFHEGFLHSYYVREVAYGFGASKGTRQHKVVRLKSESDYCHVYTLGTGRWRRVEAATASASSIFRSAFANGDLYWLVSDSSRKMWICCFDMETERFSTVSSPPIRDGLINMELANLRDSLCAVDDSSDDVVMIWLLKGCGAEKSWRLEYMIDQHPDSGVLFGFDFLPLQVSKNGDILLLCADERFFCYSIKTKTYQEIPSLGASAILYSKPLLLTLSFRSLKRNFGMENVISF